MLVATPTSKIDNPPLFVGKNANAETAIVRRIDLNTASNSPMLDLRIPKQFRFQGAERVSLNLDHAAYRNDLRAES